MGDTGLKMAAARAVAWLACHVMRAVVALQPPALRARFGRAIVTEASEEIRATVRQGPMATLRVVTAAIADAARGALVERLSTLPSRKDFSMAALLGGVRSDLRLAARGLQRRPGFAATAILTLALGIGATTAVFSVVDATVLRGLRVPDAASVVSIWSAFDRHGAQEFDVSLAEFADLRADVSSFAQTGAWLIGETLFQPREADRARRIAVANTFGQVYDIVGARVVLGRLPSAADDRLDAPPVAVISHAFWTEAFGANPGVIGTAPVSADGGAPEIVGVLAPDSELPGATADVWVHTALNPAWWARDRSGHGLAVVARLRDGATGDSARAELAALEGRWAARYAGQHSYGIDGHHVAIDAIADRLLGRARRVGLLLSLASTLLLALACVNVANLLLARSETRASEIGLRAALGASSRRVAQPILLEGALIGAAGAVLGIGLAALGLPAILHLVPAEFAQAASARVDVRVAAFAIAISASTALLFTIVPAWRAARRAPTDLLRVSSRSRTDGAAGLRVLVGTQIAIASSLLIGAALLAGSLARLNAVSPGFDVSSRVSVNLVLPETRFTDVPSIAAFYELAQSRISAMPDVHAAAALRTLPLRDASRTETVIPEGAQLETDRLGVSVQAGLPGVLHALGIPLIEGRALSGSDRADAMRVALVNESAARALWPGDTAIGKRFRATFLPANTGLLTVVGVYGDVRGAGLAELPRPEIMLPLAQATSMTGWVRDLRLVVHSARPAADVIDAVRTTIRAVDPGVAVEEPTTLTEVRRATTARERLLATLLAVFSGLALLVAAVGVFGMVSFTVARERRAFAIRSALGARQAQVLGGILASNAITAGLGAIAGAAIAALAAPALAGFLYGIDPRDPLVLVGAPVVLVVIALAASLAPAVRATRVPVTVVLQQSE